VSQSVKDQRRRERLREYEAELVAARSALEVLALFVHGRESRSRGESLEEAFAATSQDGTDANVPFPAAVWVTLRQGDIDVTMHLLVESSSTDFVIAAHEQLDAGYRLTTVEENRALPDIERLQAQLATFLHVPADVVAVIASWGPDDPRTSAEIDALLEQRFGAITTRPAPASRVDETGERQSPNRPASAPDPGPGLTMSADEFGALLSLSPDQHNVLATLVRQTAIVISAH
jgi:hypothetical protein